MTGQDLESLDQSTRVTGPTTALACSSYLSGSAGSESSFLFFLSHEALCCGASPHSAASLTTHSWSSDTYARSNGGHEQVLRLLMHAYAPVAHQKCLVAQPHRSKPPCSSARWCVRDYQALLAPMHAPQRCHSGGPWDGGAI